MKKKNLEFSPEVIKGITKQAADAGTLFKPYAEGVLAEHSRCDLLRCKQLLSEICNATNSENGRGEVLRLISEAEKHLGL